MLLSFVLIQLVQLFVATESFRQFSPYAKRSPSLTRLQHTEDGSSILNEGNDKSKSDGLDQCPFSKSFGRYHVSLSSSSKLKRNEAGGFQLFPFQKSFSESVARTKLEKRLLSGEKLIWMKNLDGVAAFSFLWEQASPLIHDNDGPSSAALLSKIVALPDAAPSLVQNWVEIVEWMNNQPELVPSGAASILVSLLTEADNVPAVRIQLVGSRSSAIDSANEPSITVTSDQVVSGTRSWVKRILVDQGICPFTKSDRKSGQGLSDVGVPVGGILYSTSFAIDPIQLQANTWNTIKQMLEAGPSGKGGISSILLAAPYFDDNFDLWAGPIFAMLEAGVVAAQAQQQVGVVCFHPLYATPDGTSWVRLSQGKSWFPCSLYMLKIIICCSGL